MLISVIRLVIYCAVFIIGTKLNSTPLPDTVNNNRIDTVFNNEFTSYTIEDIDNDKQSELVVMTVGGDTENPDELYPEFSITVYKSDSAGLWTKIDTINNDEMLYYRPAKAYKERIIQKGLNTVLGGSDRLMYVRNSTKDGTKIIMIPVFMNAFYAVKIISYDNKQLKQRAEIEGLELIIDSDNDGNYEFIGRDIKSDTASVSLVGHTYFSYSFKGNELNKSEVLNDVVFKELLRRKDNQFKKTNTINDFVTAYLFQIAQKRNKDAKIWFKNNEKKIKNQALAATILNDLKSKF
ncbi:MAG: hypothetical protein A2015_12530 [Spirochaetes bacterium GWF1_31_7]|nr:MAG: hypothetical protein A2Y30_12480 [Spirochaetes bacterium GWE1_32_154]OHD44815.1 MAG: hypothetical protein A2Y29_03395 [Spirochaetes bacterium GWE2_31_10]OHD49606.1 MAG: hypothetical protein A2015_12530 [Spirochaetes bacterium GWF1_31_7]OHD82755.1 MAG: hypothetical protein A2355_05275 [Spirochaetes bacterium RIFOXYB1_FULL_32_8]HBD93755.1 hypothetical protein [Spirochaetia bacterium]